MISIFQSLFTRNRRSRVPVEDQDFNLHLSEEEDQITNENENSASVSDEQTFNDEIIMEEGGQSRVSAERNSSNVSDADIAATTIATSGPDDNMDSTSPNTNDSGSLSLSRQQLFQFQILNQSIPQRYSQTENSSSEENLDRDQTYRDDDSVQARRQSTFLLIIMIFLIKLWIDAIQTGDFGLLVLSITSTVWISGKLRERQEAEEWNAEQRLNRAVIMDEERMLENMGMSYQAQISAAIWESRILAMMGGIAEREENIEGVAEETQSRWQRFTLSETKKGNGYRTLCSVSDPSSDSNSSGDNNASKIENIELACEEDATCSICLSEYENGDQIVKLPCDHLYHNDCVTSWTRNHVRCPLCNFDLQAGNTQSESPNFTTPETSSSTSN